ncbi:hypothetical protein LTR22_026710 [Elasticomyces elasticus]|nr:hypothetical protein LTR22_026710 [Elasticomyces elasticus]KAK4901035.1 hypothetical protein LTR49_027357 [Elasticomyces elasticus]
MLAGVVYCTRVLGVEVILPSDARETQAEADDERFRQQRDEYLADGTYSVVSKMLSLLAYGKSIALSHNNAGIVSWSLDRTVMSYHGRPIKLARLQEMISSVTDEAADKLRAELMWTRFDDRFEMPLEQFQDDVTFTKRGMSFITNSTNGLQDKRDWILQHASTHPEGRKLRSAGSWSKTAVQKYLRQVDRFRELLLLCVHVTGGQPARGSEITTIRFRIGFLQDRNVFVIQGQMVVVTRYHKSQSQLDKPKVIPRFLPGRVGQLLAIYLTYVQPLQQYLGEEVRGSGYSDYVWSNEYGPWGTERLTKVITHETRKRLGVRLTALDYRHVAISIGREVVEAQFARGYIEETSELEEAEVDEDDGLEVSAGRSAEIGGNRYGVSLDVIKHLSSRSIDKFRSLSAQWHAFLELISSRQAAGQKRGGHARSDSSSVGSEQQHEQRRFALARQNNGIHGWAEMLTRYGQGGSSPTLQVTPQPGLPGTPLAQWHSASITPSVASGLEVSPLWSRSLAAPALVQKPRTAGEAELKQAMMRKALCTDDVTFRSEKQREALHAVVSTDSLAPMVVVLPTGGGKSLLFMAPACLEDAVVTVVVVPYRALLENLLSKAKQAGIDCMVWKGSEVNPAALVFVSADLVDPFMGTLAC